MPILALVAYLVPIYSFTIHPSRGVFYSPNDSPFGGAPQPTVELLVSKSDQDRLFSHGNVQLYYNDCRDRAHDVSAGFLRPRDKQPKGKLDGDTYPVQFAVNPTMAPMASRWIFADVKRNLKCVYVRVPRVFFNRVFVSNIVRIPPS